MSALSTEESVDAAGPAAGWTTDRALRLLSTHGAPVPLIDEDQLGRTIEEILADRRGPAVAAHDRSLDGGRGYYHHVAGDREFAVVTEPLRRLSGEITGVVALARDVTGERQRKRSEAAAPAVARSTDHGIVARLGIGVRVYELRDPDDAASVIVEDTSAAVAEGFPTLSGVQLAEAYREVGLGAETVNLGDLEHEERGARRVFSAQAFTLSTGRVEVLFTDVTAVRQLESELRQARKMEAVGQLAGGVAHDINNLLMAISGYATFALDRVDQDDHGLHADLSEVQAACERASAMTQQLLAFSRRQVLEPRAVDVNDILSDTGRLLGRLIGEDIELVVELDPRPSTVRADRGQIEQVLMNLALNARDAMPGGGTLRMKTESIDATGGGLSGVGEVTPGLYVRIGVEDTGCGMDAGTLEHIFEPFFTTKDVGEGTGLGLATMQGIVKQSGGYVGVESRVGTGTAFGIYLPVIVEELSGIPEPVLSPVGGHERVLLVEDDTVVRMVVRRMLESQGYDVTAFGDPHAALASAAMHDFDLLVTDIVMPGMTGRELVEHIKANQPRLRVLYVSGYTESAVLARGVSTEQNALLQKPFSSAELGSTVRRLLDAA